MAEILARKEAEIAQLLAEKESLSTALSQAEFNVSVLEAENANLKRIIYGQKRERYVSSLNPNQLVIELGLEPGPGPEEEEPPAEQEEISYSRKKPSKKKVKPTGRQPWPSHLKRVEQLLLPDCDIEGMKKIGEHRTEELEYIPAKPFVRVYVRPIFADPAPDPKTEKTRVICAELPPRIIPKSSIGPGMLAVIVCDKFLDHLPIYRQVKRYERLGVRIARSTIGNLLGLLAQQLSPLAIALQNEVFRTNYLQADETRIQVLDKTHNLSKSKKKGPPGKTHRGFFWSYYDPVKKLCHFEYCHGRGKEYPKEALKDFKGKLQTDGYGSYDQFSKSEVISLVGCLAHVRRKFFEARSNDPKRAKIALDFIKELYAIEGQAREKKMSFEKRLELRIQQAKPIWEKYTQWIEEQLPEVLPQSAIGKAIAHADKRKPFIQKYLEDGKLEIDNNLVENQIRPIALGRKNYLFAGSQEGAKRAAMFYSLLASCKQNDIDPLTWLRHVLIVLPTHPINQIQQLLPHNWKSITEPKAEQPKNTEKN